MRKSTVAVAVCFFVGGTVAGVWYAEEGAFDEHLRRGEGFAYSVARFIASAASIDEEARVKGPAEKGIFVDRTAMDEETKASFNNLSFPVIFSDNARPPGYVDIDREHWRFAGIANLTTDCVQEENSAAPVADDLMCYYGRPIRTEQGGVAFLGNGAEDKRVWWLQQRPENLWQAFDPTHPSLSPLTVTAVDWAEALESSKALVQGSIPVQTTLLLDAGTDPEFGPFVAFGGPCDADATPDRCFAAFAMSGPVPGTQDTDHEIQGADFGPGSAPFPGTRRLVDPATLATDEASGTGFHATVYSGCARLLIQRIAGDPTLLSWNSKLGYWISGADAPLVNKAVYSGGYDAHIDASGKLGYAFSWDAETALPGDYRLTFVLDDQPRCPLPLNTLFDDDTFLANGGTAAGLVVSRGSLQRNFGGAGLEGGLAFIDITLDPAEKQRKTAK